MNIFERRVLSALGRISPGAVYLASVSGGADSTALLAALSFLRNEAGFNLHCIHIEHGIRPPRESRGDAAAVADLALRLKVPCRIVSIPYGKIAALAASGGHGIEAAARFFRRRAWKREAERIGAERILTGHTLDDTLENILMRILRGAGPAGLAPMPQNSGLIGAKRADTSPFEAGLLITRPLLELSRQDVLCYLEQKGLSWRIDSTNTDTRFFRNRVRGKLVPVLDEFFPHWKKSLLAMSETQSMIARFLSFEAGDKLPWEVSGGRSGKAPAVRLSEKDFFRAQAILREEALFSGIDILAKLAGKNEAAFKPPRRRAIRRAAESGNTVPRDMGEVCIERRNGFLEMTAAKKPRGETGFSLLIKEAGFYTLKGGILCPRKDCVLKISVTPFSEARGGETVFTASLPLVLRNHNSRDLLVKAGHRRRFSDILVTEEKPESAGVITAEDADGIAAFIFANRSGALAIAGREAAAEEGLTCSFALDVCTVLPDEGKT